MRKVRRWFRNLVLHIPVIGESQLLPRMRGCYERLPFLDQRRKWYARDEARRLLRVAADGATEFTVVYDCKVTGLAYGDLLHVLSIARFLNAMEARVSFVMVETEGPHFLPGLGQGEIDRFIDDAMTIARLILNPARSRVVRSTPEELGRILDEADENGVLFEEFTRGRRPYYRDAFNVFNQLMATLDADDQRQVLFGFEDFREHFPRSFEGRSYVTWHCRYSVKWDVLRKTNEEELILGYAELMKRFPGREIVIVSDTAGCEHYAAMADELGLEDLVFSKDVSSDFLGDCALIMGSEFFFCYRGGGILEVPLMSRMPFDCIAPVMNETMWNDHQLGSWQTESQRWINVPRERDDGELRRLLGAAQ